MVNFENSFASEIDVNSLFNFLFHGGYGVIKTNFTTAQFIKKEEKTFNFSGGGRPDRIHVKYKYTHAK